MNDSYIDDRKLHEECGVFGAYDFDCGDVRQRYIMACLHYSTEDRKVVVSL